MADTSLIIQGTCAPGFDHLWEVFGANFAASCPEGDPDLGACVSLTLEGETVVDLWGGFRDAAATQPWTRDTIVCVFSISKAIAAVCMHVMRDRGLLDIDAPVAEFWPEFAQSGKAGITTRMVLSHTAGLLRANVPEGSLWQPGVLLSAIEAMRPEWEPGEAAGYHSFTQGPILQEIARRVTSRSLGQFLRDELARPLDAAIASGLTADEVARCAEIIPNERNGTIAPFRHDPSSAVYRDWAALPRDETFNSSNWRKTEFFSLAGHGNACGIVRLLAPLATGGVSAGRRVLGPKAVASAIAEHWSGYDRFAEAPARYAAGFQMSDATYPFSGSPDCIGFHGIGGSIGFADPSRRMSFAYCGNRLISGSAGANPKSRRLIAGCFRT